MTRKGTVETEGGTLLVSVLQRKAMYILLLTTKAWEQFVLCMSIRVALEALEMVHVLSGRLDCHVVVGWPRALASMAVSRRVVDKKMGVTASRIGGEGCRRSVFCLDQLCFGELWNVVSNGESICAVIWNSIGAHSVRRTCPFWRCDVAGGARRAAWRLEHAFQSL